MHRDKLNVIRSSDTNLAGYVLNSAHECEILAPLAKHTPCVKYRAIMVFYM